MKKLLFILLLWAGTRISLADFPCTTQSCTNDYWGPPAQITGILGDETIAFTFTDNTSGPVEGFEVWIDGDKAPCLVLGPLVRSFLIAGTSCAQNKSLGQIKIRAFNHQIRGNSSSAIQYGGFSNTVELLKFMCIANGYEQPCYTGASCILPAAYSKSCSNRPQ